MPRVAAARAFDHIAKAHQVGVDIGGRIVDRIAHAGLGGKVHHGIEPLACEQSAHALAIDNIEHPEIERRMGFKAREARLLQRNLVIIVEVVDAGDPVSACKQAQGQGASDEPG